MSTDKDLEELNEEDIDEDELLAMLSPGPEAEGPDGEAAHGVVRPQVPGGLPLLGEGVQTNAGRGASACYAAAQRGEGTPLCSSIREHLSHDHTFTVNHRVGSYPFKTALNV